MTNMTILKQKRGSTRIKENERRQIIDPSSRRRRIRKMMESLERDNAHDDPHADLVMSKKVPRFEDSLESRTRTKKKEKNPEYYAMKYRKTFQQLIEEDRKEAEEQSRPSYEDLAAPPSQFPPFQTCSVCGFGSTYICVSCGARVCDQHCFDTHYVTRCLKWMN